MNICIIESLCCTPETNTTLLINYNPVKFKKSTPSHLSTEGDSIVWVVQKRKLGPRETT